MTQDIFSFPSECLELNAGKPESDRDWVTGIAKPRSLTDPGWSSSKKKTHKTIRIGTCLDLRWHKFYKNTSINSCSPISDKTTTKYKDNSYFGKFHSNFHKWWLKLCCFHQELKLSWLGSPTSPKIWIFLPVSPPPPQFLLLNLFDRRPHALYRDSEVAIALHCWWWTTQPMDIGQQTDKLFNVHPDNLTHFVALSPI